MTPFSKSYLTLWLLLTSNVAIAQGQYPISLKQFNSSLENYTAIDVSSIDTYVGKISTQKNGSFEHDRPSKTSTKIETANQEFCINAQLESLQNARAKLSLSKKTFAEALRTKGMRIEIKLQDYTLAKNRPNEGGRIINTLAVGGPLILFPALVKTKTHTIECKQISSEAILADLSRAGIEAVAGQNGHSPDSVKADPAK